MPTYQVTDPQSGVSLELTGDSPPTEAELVELFAQYSKPQEPQKARNFEDDIFAGLPQDIIDRIKNEVPDQQSFMPEVNAFGASEIISQLPEVKSEKVIDRRKKLADFERLRIRNPDLASMIENTGSIDAALISAGELTKAAGAGLGLAEDITPDERAAFEGLQTKRPISTGIGEFGAGVGTFAIPGGSLLSKLGSASAKIAGASALGAAEFGAITSGRGGSPQEVASSMLLGAALPAALGSKQIARGLTNRFNQAVEAGKTVTRKIPQSETKKEIARLIKESPTDSRTAKYMLDGSQRVVKDKLAVETIRQGFDPSIVAAIKGSSKADKRKMLKMLGIQQKGNLDKRFAVENRPSDIVGDSILARFRAVRDINKQAGLDVDKAAQKLKGIKVDIANSKAEAPTLAELNRFLPGPERKTLKVKDTIDTFIDELNNIGVKFGDDLTPNFSGSDIEDVAPAENLIKNIIKRMSKGGSLDAYDVHRMKRFIDEQVDYGKAGQGLTGASERIVKNLRRNLDKNLDDAFPDYRKANTKYSETIQALKFFEKKAGGNFDVLSENADKFVGTLSRRVMSNAQSRVPIMDSINELQNISKKYGIKFEDDVLTQALFYDELESIFGSAAQTSLQGVTEKVVKKGAQAAQGGSFGVAADVIAKGAEAARGINEKNAINALRKLIMDGL